jgi:hypothetical protein
VPIGGFKNLKGLYGPQKYSIARAVEVSQLPHASTWYPIFKDSFSFKTSFNMLKLPEYESIDILRKNLKVAVHYGTEGFGFQ